MISCPYLETKDRTNLKNEQSVVLRNSTIMKVIIKKPLCLALVERRWHAPSEKLNQCFNHINHSPYETMRKWYRTEWKRFGLHHLTALIQALDVIFQWGAFLAAWDPSIWEVKASLLCFASYALIEVRKVISLEAQMMEPYKKIGYIALHILVKENEVWVTFSWGTETSLGWTVHAFS